MAAIATFPNFNLTFFKYFHCFNIFKKFSVSFLVMFFNCGNKFELCR